MFRSSGIDLSYNPAVVGTVYRQLEFGAFDTPADIQRDSKIINVIDTDKKYIFTLSFSKYSVQFCIIVIVYSIFDHELLN